MGAGYGTEGITMALLAAEPPVAHRVGWGFIALYALAYMSTSLLFVAPLLVTMPLKVNSLAGIDQAPNSLALVAGVGALLAMVANPLFGKMSDRTASRWGMRRPWMITGLAGGCLGIVVVALAPAIPVVLAGWCIAQLSFNALLAAMVAVLPDQVPSVQRGLVSGVLGVCLPVASVCATFLVKSFTGSLLAMFLGPCAIGGFFILFAATLHDLGVFNIAGALPFSIAPAIAPVILTIGGGSYGVLYAVAGLCAIIGAFAVLPVKRVR